MASTFLKRFLPFKRKRADEQVGMTVGDGGDSTVALKTRDSVDITTLTAYAKAGFVTIQKTKPGSISLSDGMKQRFMVVTRDGHIYLFKDKRVADFLPTSDTARFDQLLLDNNSAARQTTTSTDPLSIYENGQQQVQIPPYVQNPSKPRLSEAASKYSTKEMAKILKIQPKKVLDLANFMDCRPQDSDLGHGIFYLVAEDGLDDKGRFRGYRFVVSSKRQAAKWVRAINAVRMSLAHIRMVERGVDNRE